MPRDLNDESNIGFMVKSMALDVIDHIKNEGLSEKKVSNTFLIPTLDPDHDVIVTVTVKKKIDGL